MLAKRFAYVCAGLFLLVLTYQVGARAAIAQGNSAWVGGFFFEGQPRVCAADGTRLIVANIYASLDPPQTVLLPHPGTVVACTARAYPLGGIESAYVLYDDGSVWYYDTPTGVWTMKGSLFNAPTSAAPTTWGKVKADYRR